MKRIGSLLVNGDDTSAQSVWKSIADVVDATCVMQTERAVKTDTLLIASRAITLYAAFNSKEDSRDPLVFAAVAHTFLPRNAL